MADIPKTYSNSREFTEAIQVRFEFEGFHRWKDAPQEVAFLKNWHRHMFKCRVFIEVKHDDRELEYFMVLNRINKQIIPFMETAPDDISSCEQKAKYIANGLINTYGEERRYVVEVTEDGENGSIVQWPKLS